MTPQSLNAIVELVDANDQKHDEAHGRLRTDLRACEARLESNYTYFRERLDAMSGRVERVDTLMQANAQAPVNIDKLFLSPRVLLTLACSLVFGVGSVSGVFWATTSGMKTDIAELKAALAVKQAKDDSRADVQDARDKALSNDVGDMKRQLQLEQYEIQNLKELLNGKGK